MSHFQGTHTRMTHLQSFVAGASFSACVALVVYAWKTKNNEQCSRTSTSISDSQSRNSIETLEKNHSNVECPHARSSTKNASSSSSIAEPLMDSVGLDQRMIRKAEGAILNRTSRLVIVVERCTNDHNYSAIMRTAEALGVQHIWIIAPQCIQTTLGADSKTEQSNPANSSNGPVRDTSNELSLENTKLKRASGQIIKRATESEKQDRALHHLFAKNATEWLTVREFSDTKSCIDELKKDDREIWVTDLSQVATCLTEDGLLKHLKKSGKNYHGGKLIPNKVAIVFGTEAVGCTAEMLGAADLRVYLPLRGFADSLNLSVATALVVHQMFVLDPTLAGSMSDEERKELRQIWYAKLASQRLLSSREKKNRAKLVSFIKGCEDIGRKISAGESVYKEERDKWDQMEAKQLELDAIDNRLMIQSQIAVKDLVENPPMPITDMRRADEHRTCYVGKKTKKMYGNIWADMPATAKKVVEPNVTASFFRNRANIDPHES